MNSITCIIILALHFLNANITLPDSKAPVYHLSEPDQVLVLDSDLDEISGLSYFDGLLYAVQDEKGTVFTLNPSTGEIISERKCWKKGDFEAVEIADGFVFMLKSNGNLYRTPLDDLCEEKTEKIDLGFNNNWNFEGMGYDPFSKSLLIVAKRSEYASVNEVYCLPIGDLKSLGEPCYLIDEQVLKGILMKNNDSWSERMAQKMSYSFNPSGIAVHPQTGDIYILSSPARQLLLLTKEWKIKKLIKLGSDLYSQPEGICFDSDLNLYIGNEARNGKPKILIFHPK